MNKQKIEASIQEAKKFIERAELLLKDLKEEKRDYIICGTKLSGALRRQSLELTNSLATLRKP